MKHGNCNRCGNINGHTGKCPALVNSWKCDYCGKIGHTKKVCNKRLKQSRRRMSQLNAVDIATQRIAGLALGEYNFINSLSNGTKIKPPEFVFLSINGVNIKFEIDTGACSTVLYEHIYLEHFSMMKLHPVVDCQFTAANGSKCEILGKIFVLVKETFHLEALICKTNPLFQPNPLIGRTWLDNIYPGWRNFFQKFANAGINGLDSATSILNPEVKLITQELREQFSSVFERSNDPIKNFKVHLELKEIYQPKFMKAVEPPFALRNRVEQMLTDLQSQGILKPVKFSNWASQIVLAKKKSGDIRICCNFKTTINPQLYDDKRPIPRMDDILSRLGGNSYFSLIDLSGAYLQLELDSDSQELTTINTHVGLFSHTRLPFGVKTAPSIFQSAMDKILNGCVGADWYFDDIIIRGRNLEECKDRTVNVLIRLRTHNVHANFEKCEFFKTQIEYLGFLITPVGVGPSPSKIEAIIKANPPHDLTSLRSFLGFLNFYSKFLPNLQSLLHPLRKLLEKKTPFQWSQKCQETFESLKQMIANSKILVHYDPTKSLVIVSDAGPYGVGAILNVIINNEERPCYMVSSSLSKAEQNYSQLHREALAIVFAVKKFHKYIYGYHVIIYTDCQALESLLSQKKDLGTIINSRFLRWILFLSNYDLTIKYRPSKKTQNADALSRLPMNEPTTVQEIFLNTVSLNLFNSDPDQLVSIKDIGKRTHENHLCKLLFNVIKEGWPSKDNVPNELISFYKFRLSLDIDEDCIFYGDRIFVPPTLRQKILSMVHKEHVGMVKSKKLIRTSVWWPKIDLDLEHFISSCKPCQTFASRRNNAPLVSRNKSAFPFERIHLDHFYFENDWYLVIVDDFSNWCDVDYNRSCSTIYVIETLRRFMANFGLPKIVVSDNATCFTSEQFKNFLSYNGIAQETSPPYHPQSNGLAERYVGITKQNLRKSLSERKSGITVKHQLQNFLFMSHTTPLSDTDTSPADIIYNLKVKTPLLQLSRQAISSDGQNPVKGKSIQNGEKKSHPQKIQKGHRRKPNHRYRWNHPSDENNFMKNKIEYNVGMNILYYFNKVWIDAEIIRKLSSMTYLIKFPNGSQIKAHIDQIKPKLKTKYIPTYIPNQGTIIVPNDQPIPVDQNQDQNDSNELNLNSPINQQVILRSSDNVNDESPVNNEVPLRRSLRNKKLITDYKYLTRVD